MIQNCLNHYQDTQLLKIPFLVKYALVLLLFLDVTPTVPLSHMICLHVGNPTHNSTHSMLGSPIPTISPKVNLTLILRLMLTLALLTLLNPTNPNRNCQMMKFASFRRIRLKRKHDQNDAIFSFQNTANLGRPAWGQQFCNADAVML